MIVLLPFCVHSMELIDHSLKQKGNLPDFALYGSVDKNDQIYIARDDWCKLQSDKLKRALNEVDQLYRSQGNFDKFDLSLLSEQSYFNQTKRWLSSFIWEPDELMSDKINDHIAKMMGCVWKDADPNIASDQSQLRVLHLMVTLGDIVYVEDVESLVVNCEADPTLKDAFGDDAFAYAKRLEAKNVALAARMVAALQRYKE